MFLKHVIVLPLLENACNEEQRKLFLEPARRHEFASAYAQTEMAHGTDVQKLETTATYDPETEEFVLNSPNIPSSLKWWPGGLGKAASMAVLMAQLWTKGTCYGMHPFFVQIRDFETHLPLPGVIVGDIGPTFANNTNDNGYLGFKQFRVPRISLLMKHCSVTFEWIQ
jgi:acyl-CoA oxidase